jgi:hypothetical protein
MMFEGMMQEEGGSGPKGVLDRGSSLGGEGVVAALGGGDQGWWWPGGCSSP